MMPPSRGVFHPCTDRRLVIMEKNADNRRAALILRGLEAFKDVMTWVYYEAGREWFRRYLGDAA